MLMLRCLLLVLVTATASGLASAQSLSGKPVRLVVPFPPGGPTDIVARPLAQLLGEAMKINVIIDNRGGAGGTVGADAVAKAAPDGTTLLIGNVGTHAIGATLYKKLPYDPMRDFTPLALVAAAPVAVVVHPSLAVSNLAELIALAKRNPGKLTFGTAGNGTPGHLTGAMFRAAADVDLVHVPYKGSAPAVTDLLGGQISMMFDPLQSVLSHMQAGKIRGIAVSSSAPSPVVPNLPTIASAGFPGFEFTAWWGVFAPANLPAPLEQLFAAEIERVTKSSAFRDKLGPLGVSPTALTLKPFAEFLRAETAKWGRAVRESGATPE